jgi:hypothetical protein
MTFGMTRSAVAPLASSANVVRREITVKPRASRRGVVFIINEVWNGRREELLLACIRLIGSEA